MTLTDVLAWVKSLGTPGGVDAWTMARLDPAGERRVGLWQRPTTGSAGTALGGDACTVTRTKRVELLVHWTRDAAETEAAAQALYDAIRTDVRPTVGGASVCYVAVPMPEPVDLGADERGIFERAIWLDIYYKEA